MRNLKTNLALLMELAQVRPEELCDALGVDPSLISRWRTGSRRLGDRWRGRLADYFLRVRGEAVEALLNETASLGTAQGTPPRLLLERWLGEAGGSWQRREELLFLSRQGGKERRRLETGDEAVRELLMEFLDYAMGQPSPGGILFACPEGLELFTRDEGYNRPLQEKIRRVLEQGKRLQVVLRTDYRPSDVASACGPWLWAHLMGYIQSYYYDDFRLLENERILFGLRGGLMIQVRMEREGPAAEVHTDPAAAAMLEARFDACLSRSRQRFCYQFFSDPRDFLRGAAVNGEKPMYLIESLPDLGVGWETAALRLFPGERALIERQFFPLQLSPWDFEGEVRHIFCAESIDETLDMTRHLCRPLSEICKRRIYLSTQGLVTELAAVRLALERCPGYRVCFIPREQFCRIGMELGVWGNEAAIAWIPGRQSTACRDYPNVTALHGFCATVWERVSPALRTRRAAEKRLERWLERAEKFGLCTAPPDEVI